MAAMSPKPPAMAAAAPSSGGSDTRSAQSTSSTAHDEFYVATFWSYRPRAVNHILDKARAIVDVAHLDIIYDPKQQWFKVICLKDIVPMVQARLVMLLRSLDDALAWDSVFDERGDPMPEIHHPWIQSLRDCSARPASQSLLGLEGYDAALVHGADPSGSASRFRFVRLWSEIDDNEPEGIGINEILPINSRRELERSAGVSITADGMGRAIYIGGHTQTSVDRAYERLSSILKHSHDQPFQVVHLLYSEADRVFGVDARLMAAINPVLVTSSLLNPKVGSRVPDGYEAISGAASLRISLPSPSHRALRSLFGPRQPACFRLEEARRYCQPFTKFQFKAKKNTRRLYAQGAGEGPAGLSSSRLPSHAAIDKEATASDAYVETWIRGVPDHCPVSPLDSDLSAQPLSSAEANMPAQPSHSAGAGSTSTSCATKISLLSEIPLDAPVTPCHELAPRRLRSNSSRPQHPPFRSFVSSATAPADRPCLSEISTSEAASQVSNLWPSLAPVDGGSDGCPPRPHCASGTWPEIPGVAANASWAQNCAQESSPSIYWAAGTQLKKTSVSGPASPVWPLESVAIACQSPTAGPEAWPLMKPVGSLDEFTALEDPIECLSLTAATEIGPLEKSNCLLPAARQGRTDASRPGTHAPQNQEPLLGPVLPQSDLLGEALPRIPSSALIAHPGDPRTITFDMEALVPTRSSATAGPKRVKKNNDNSRVFFKTMNQKAASRRKSRRSGWLETTKSDPEPGFLRDLTANMARLCERLRSKSGNVALKIAFGRICLKDFTPSGLATNNRNQDARSWKPEELLQRMQKAYSCPESFVFTESLSLYGQDADMLCRCPRAAPWVLDSRRVVYEFLCEGVVTIDGQLIAPTKQFVVEINVVDFSFTLRDPDSALAPVAVHCLHRHWDFEVVASHSSTKRLETMFSEFARGLVNSLEIPPNTSHSPTLHYELNPTGPFSGGGTGRALVKGVRVRYTARHRNPSGATYLDVTQIQDMTIISHGMREGRERFHSFPARELTSVWFEASLSSVKAEHLFRDNESLELGEEAAWTVDSMEKGGCFTALWEPALAMIKEMDGIGVLSKNGLKVKEEEGAEETGKAKCQEKDTEGFW